MVSKAEVRPPAGEEKAHRDAAEVREYESRVWDLTRHLIHPAFLYVVLQVVFWGGIERNPAFRGEALSFWERSGIHILQFVGAWGVFYGTLLRDMRVRTRAQTIVVWIAAVSTAGVWAWPGAVEIANAPALWAVLAVNLVAGFVGWVVVMVTWRRAKSRHEVQSGNEAAPPPGPEAGRG
jgi:hypothetical protein